MPLTMARKDTEERDQEREENADENHAEPRVYELGFHIDPELPSEEAKSVYEQIRDLIAKNGSIVAEGEPEKIQLAYTISCPGTGGRRDFGSAYFAWVAYEASGAGHTATVAAVGEERRIIRFLDVRTTKEAARHAAEMKTLKVPEKPVEGDVSDAELSAALEEAALP